MKEELKKLKLQGIISAVIIILPCLFGLIMWNKLPNEMPVHFGVNGVDSYASKFFVIVILSLVLLVIHIVFIIMTALINYIHKNNPEEENCVEKIIYKYKIHYVIVLWAMPIVSVFCYYLIYSNTVFK